MHVIPSIPMVTIALSSAMSSASNPMSSIVALEQQKQKYVFLITSQDSKYVTRVNIAAKPLLIKRKKKKKKAHGILSHL